MEPIHRLIPALNIECPRTLNALGTTDPRLRHCRLGPRHDGKRWKTPPHVPAKRTPDRSVPSPSLFDVLSDTLGHDGPEAQSHSASPREADSMSQRAQSPAAQSPAAQWLNAPSEAHPGSCRPCWFTAKGKGCHRNGCLFCHKPHVSADVRHPVSGPRSRFAMREQWREGATASGVRCVSSRRMEATARGTCRLHRLCVVVLQSTHCTYALRCYRALAANGHQRRPDSAERAA